MARRIWGQEDPVGKRLRIGRRETPWTTVVGVVRNVRQDGLADEPRPQLYRPFALQPRNTAFLSVRTAGDAAALGAHRRRVLALVIRQGLTLATVAIAVGVVLAFACSRLLRTSLFGVTNTDPVTYVAIPLLLIVVALLSSCCRRGGRRGWILWWRCGWSRSSSWVLGLG